MFIVSVDICSVVMFLLVSVCWGVLGTFWRAWVCFSELLIVMDRFWCALCVLVYFAMFGLFWHGSAVHVPQLAAW